MDIFKTFIGVNNIPIIFISTRISEKQFFKKFINHLKDYSSRNVLNPDSQELYSLFEKDVESYSNIEIKHIQNWSDLMNHLSSFCNYKYIFIDDIDYLMKDYKGNHVISIANMLRFLRELAIRLEISISVSVSLNENVDFLNDRPDEIYSKCFSNKVGSIADNVFGLYRKDQFKKTSIQNPIAIKNRLNIIPLKYYCYDPDSFYHFDPINDSNDLEYPYNEELPI